MADFGSWTSPTEAHIWLRRFRWLQFVAQVLFLALWAALSDIPLPWLPLVLLTAGLGASNLALGLRRLNNQHALLTGSVLVFDVLLFTGILLWTGGAHNPLSILYIVHVALAAVLLNVRWTLAIALLSTGCFATLFWLPMPFPALSDHAHMHIHLYGMWLGYALTAAVLTYFLTRISNTIAQQRDEMHRLRLLALKNEQLSALVNFAGGAAHELGTPLATIALAVDELRSQNLPESALGEVRLIEEEIARSKEVIARLNAETGEALGEASSNFALALLHTDVTQQLASQRRARFRLVATKSPVITAPRKALVQAVAALVNNGFDASGAEAEVMLSAETDDRETRVHVLDCGTGMNHETLKRLGEPFFSTKAPGYGMGLGVFLAKLLAERLGGRLEIDSELGQGTKATLVFPKQQCFA